MHIARKLYAEQGLTFRGSPSHVMLTKLARGAGWPTHKEALHNVKAVDIAINLRASYAEAIHGERNANRSRQ